MFSQSGCHSLGLVVKLFCMKKISLFFTILLAFKFIAAQSVPVGHWKDYLSYKSGVSVTEGGGKVYCATTSGIFSFNKSDNSLDRLSKINGLADIEATVINYNKYSSKLLIAYKNSNIDIIDNTTITNLADIKRKPIQGNKSINTIYFINEYAYLSCGFGIVVIDMNKMEVNDTYYIGPNGGSINVRDITSDATYLYAATDGGIYRALKNSPNLANFTSWSVMSGLPTGIYNTITAFNGKIYTNHSRFLMNGQTQKDTMYVYDNVSWNQFGAPGYFGGIGYVTNSMKSFNNQLLVVFDNGILKFDTTETLTNFYAAYLFPFSGDYYRPKQALIDNNNILWIADSEYGLVSTVSEYSSEFRFPEGPGSANIVSMSLANDYLCVTPGGGGDGYYQDGLYFYDGIGWKNTRGNYPSVINLDTVYDVHNALVDPLNAKKTFVTTGLAGVIEFNNGVPVKQYKPDNSSLQHINVPGYTPTWTSGLALDANSNLWVANSGVPSSLSIKNYDNTWQALNFAPIIGNSPNLGQILIDKSDQKWCILTGGGGIMVYNGTSAAPNASNTIKMSAAKGNGALPSTNVFCMVEDKNGEIWVGTDKGIAVFYSPSAVFSGQNFDAQQILIEQDGHVQILLETELIQAIAIDDANRKWIATANSGIFLMSADGTQQILHFDKDNSPLFSNDVKSIVINHKSGEIFFGTSKGLISHRGTATEGLEDFTDVYSFPNPVKHSYDGPIAIKGLVSNSILKITDISGTLVYEMRSEGGQAIWYGKNLKGERVNTGVYMVFCTSDDGTKTEVTKILVVN